MKSSISFGVADPQRGRDDSVTYGIWRRQPHIGSFDGIGELYLLLDRCVGQRAHGTCFPPFLLCFENCMNREWAKRKEGFDWYFFFLSDRELGYVIEREGRGIEWRREAARQRAPVYVIQVNVYEKAVVKFRCSFRRRPYLCFHDGPRACSFFSCRETFELQDIDSSIQQFASRIDELEEMSIRNYIWKQRLMDIGTVTTQQAKD
ncbi:NADH dehydrogenase [ubiquinone] iron-sulfur protein 2 [Tanacetum coccineum]